MSVAVSSVRAGFARHSGQASLAVPLCRAAWQAQDASAAGSDPRPEPPEAPGPNECCESGCVPCVYDLYAEAMQEYREALAAWEQRQAGGQETAN